MKCFGKITAIFLVVTLTLQALPVYSFADDTIPVNQSDKVVFENEIALDIEGEESQDSSPSTETQETQETQEYDFSDFAQADDSSEFAEIDDSFEF